MSFPARISRKGEWSGLRVVLRVLPESLVENVPVAGVKVILNHPSVFPNDYSTLPLFPPGTHGSIEIVPTVYSTNDDLKGLKPADRQCLYTVMIWKLKFESVY